MNKLSIFAGVSFALAVFTTQAMALNPQPEPPGRSRAVQTASPQSSIILRHGALMLNPQPLPP